MSALNKTIDWIDHITLLTGKTIAWLTLAMMLISCLVVALRYGANIGSIALQESVTYMHVTVFLLGCAFTLRRDGHVRVDIFYRKLSTRQKALVNLIGGLLLLLPLCLFILFSTWDYVLQSWYRMEVSPEPGGLPFVYLLKTLMPVMAVSLFFQGVAETLRNLLVLVTGYSVDESPHNDSGPAL